MKRNFNFSFLNANLIKILAALFMLIDHVGVMLFPQIKLLRILGRLSLPLFAFMIAEGAHFTKNKLKYFLIIFILGVLFQIVYFVLYSSLYMGILITFSTSILMIYALQFFKRKLLNGKVIEKVYSFLLFASSVVLTYLLNELLLIDYGFWGCTLAVFASLFRFNYKTKNGDEIKNFDFIPINVLSFALGLFLLCLFHGGIQYYSLLTLPILLLYSGKKGKLKMKYFFYVFYPAHFVVLYTISLLI